MHPKKKKKKKKKIVHRGAVWGSERLEVVLETIHPILLRASLAWIFATDEFSVHQPLREAPGVSGHGSREQKSPLSNGSFHALAGTKFEVSHLHNIFVDIGQSGPSMDYLSK